MLVLLLQDTAMKHSQSHHLTSHPLHPHPTIVKYLKGNFDERDCIEAWYIMET